MQPSEFYFNYEAPKGSHTYKMNILVYYYWLKHINILGGAWGMWQQRTQYIIFYMYKYKHFTGLEKILKTSWHKCDKALSHYKVLDNLWRLETISGLNYLFE